MGRKSPPKLVDPHAAHLQEQLRILGIPSGKDRTLAAQRLARRDTSAGEPRVVQGNIADGTALRALLGRLQDQGRIIDQTEEGGDYGRTLYNPTLVNANSPDFRVKTQGTSDTASTTNTGPSGATVSAMTDLITLGVGKWAIAVLGSIHLANSAGGSVDISTEIDGVEGTIRTFSSVGTAGERCEAHSEVINEVDWLQGEQDVNVRVRFRSTTAGTTSAKNPRLLTIVRRMA